MPSRPFPKLIQDLLLAFDLKVRELAELVKVTPKTVRRWKRGESKPHDDNLINLLRAFDCSNQAELEARIDSALKAQRMASYSDIASRIDSLQGLQRDIFLIEFIQEPGKDRRGIMLDYPTLWEKRQEIREAHERNMESAETLFRSLLRIEETLS